MVAVVGTYQNGYVKLDKEYITDNPVRVIVTFLEEIEAGMGKAVSLSDFSFSKSQDNLQHLKSSLAEEVINDRREVL